MAITKTRVNSSLNKTMFKVTATAAADTITLPIKTAITMGGSGNSTFSAANSTIVRSIGDWVADGVVVGTVLVITTTLSNNGTFIVKAVTATTVTIETNTSTARNYLVDEVFFNAVYTGTYKSDFLHYGQIFTLASPKVNIAELSHTCAGTGQITITRGSVVTHNLFGSLRGFHAPSNESNTSDLVVLFTTTAGGTLMLELSKVEGFSAINPRTLPY